MIKTDATPRLTVDHIFQMCILASDR
jgi:hypothetical protein